MFANLLLYNQQNKQAKNQLQNVVVTTLDDLYSSISSIKLSWIDQTSQQQPIDQIKLCKISSQPSTSAQPLVITHSLLINNDCTWDLFVHGRKVIPATNGLLSLIPNVLNQQMFLKLINIIDSSKICPGNVDTHFVDMGNARKGKFLTTDGVTKAAVEEGFPLLLNGKIYTSTVRMINCEVLIQGAKCIHCQSYRSQLRAMYSRCKRKESDTCNNSKYTNNRHLKTPEKIEKLKILQTKVIEAGKQIKSLTLRMSKLSTGVSIDEALHTDLLGIAEQHNTSIMELFPVGSFRRLFWEEQVKAAKLSHARQMRWHPMVIRWCLNLKLLSTFAYHSMQTSGFIKLVLFIKLFSYVVYL